VYGNVCKKHIPSYSLYDNDIYNEKIMDEIIILPVVNNSLTRKILNKKFNKFKTEKCLMSNEEKMYCTLLLLKNTFSLSKKLPFDYTLKNSIKKQSEYILEKLETFNLIELEFYSIKKYILDICKNM
jgi:hypothetical protein